MYFEINSRLKPARTRCIHSGFETNSHKFETGSHVISFYDQPKIILPSILKKLISRELRSSLKCSIWNWRSRFLENKFIHYQLGLEISVEIFHSLDFHFQNRTLAVRARNFQIKSHEITWNVVFRVFWHDFRHKLCSGRALKSRMTTYDIQNARPIAATKLKGHHRSWEYPRDGSWLRTRISGNRDVSVQFFKNCFGLALSNLKPAPDQWSRHDFETNSETGSWLFHLVSES